MEKINFNNDITWRYIALRVALVLGTVGIIVWFMPRDNKVNFKMEVNKVWLYNDLNAQFDFPVYKTDSLVQAEQKEVLRDFAPYYVYHHNVSERQEKLLSEHLRKNFHGFGYHFQHVMLNTLHLVYALGIVDTKEPLGQQVDSAQMLRRINGKDVTMVSALKVMTPRQAYERIVRSPEMTVYREVLKEIDLNNFLEPNLTYDEDRSESARLDLLNSVPLAVDVVQSGQKIISQGEVVTEKTYQIIASYQKEWDRRNESDSAFNLMVSGETLFVLIIITLFIIYLSIYRKDFFEQMRYVGMLFMLIIIATLMASLLVEHSLLHVYILPFAIVPIFVRVFMDSRTAIMTHLTVVLITASILQKPLEFISVEMIAGLVAVFSLRELSSRSQLFWTAILTSMAAMLTNLAIFMIRHNDFSQIDNDEYVFLAICGIVIFCSYPMLYLIEKLFGFTSDIWLLAPSSIAFRWATWLPRLPVR